MTLLGRDVAEIDALVTDRYLDALLASGDLPAAPFGRDAAAQRGGSGGPAGGFGGLGGLRLDAAVRLASARLTRDLPRFHPSFRFEERLALRLAAAAAAMRLPAAAGAEGSMATLPVSPSGLPGAPGTASGPGDLDPLAGFDPLADPDEDVDREGPTVPRPFLIGGAVAASALSLAGAAWVAWRRSRGGNGSPMARAARAAHAVRERPAQG